MKTLFMILVIFSTNGNEPKKNNDSLELNKKALWNEIKNSGIEYPDIVFGQAILETGNLKSKLVRENNNLFGMRLPGQRKTLALRSKNGYSYYKNWKESVQDYKLFQDYIFRKKKMNRKEFIAWLNKKYSKTTGYFDRVQRVIKQNFEIMEEKI